MSAPCKFATHEEARKAGWFSRRHENSAAHQKEHERQRIRRADKQARAELISPPNGKESAE